MRAYGANRLTAVAAALLLSTAALLAIATLEPGALWSRAVAFVFAVQRDLHRALAAAMRSVQANEAAAAWSLAGLGFLYGVFHAAGPASRPAIAGRRQGNHAALEPIAALASGTPAP